MLQKLKKAVKLLREVVSAPRRLAALENDLRVLRGSIRALERELANRTTIGVDIGFRPEHANYAILVGRLGNTDYVQTFMLPSSDFRHLKESLTELSKYASSRRVDAPPMMRGVF